MSLPVVTVGAEAGGYVQGLEQLRGPVTVVRRCDSIAELIAVCQSGIARAAVITGDAGELTGALAARVMAAGVALLVLADSDETARRLDALHVAHAPGGVDPAELAALLTSAVETLERGSAQSRTAAAAAYGDPAAALGRREQDAGDFGDGPATGGFPPGGEAHREGKVAAVWGPAGAPGRTTVAINLAAEAAAAGRSVLLIDADTYGPSIAACLGLLDESAGIAQACRLADQGLLDAAALDRVAAALSLRGARLRVLTGITRPDRWPELRGSALGILLDLARATADLTVVDCGFNLEAEEELSFDTMAPRRNAAALRVLEAADTVFAVGAADSVGVPRLVRALGELSAVVPAAGEIRVILNKVRASAVGRQPEKQLRDAWERFGPGGGISAFLPSDVESADAALLAGSALLEVAPSSALRKAIAALAAAPAARGLAGAARTK